MTMPGIMPALERHPGQVRQTGGPLGRDTRTVLSEMLGMRDNQIEELAAQGVIGVAREEAMGGARHG